MSPKLKTGVYLPNYGPFGDAQTIADLARDAENAGWDGFFLWDHIAPYGDENGEPLPCADPWLALTAAAMQTETIRLGTTVTPLPRRRPQVLARQTATLDLLSGGRGILGVGIGGGQREWDDLGEEISLQRRGRMLDEGLAVLVGLWSGEPFDFDGEFYQIKAAAFRPTPVQQPRISIWVGGFWPHKSPFKRMARWDGMFPLYEVFGPDQSPVFSEALAFVQAERERLGLADQPFNVIKMGLTPGENPGEAANILNAAAEMGATWWLELLMPEPYGLNPSDPGALAALRERVVQGPPSEG